MSRLQLSYFSYPNMTLKFREPLELTPELDETKQLLCVQQDNIGLDAYGFTREELESEIARQLGILWKEYAMCNAPMTQDAQGIKTELLRLVECIELNQ